MSTRKIALTATAALAAAVLSACSGSTHEATPPAPATVAVNPVGATDSVPAQPQYLDVSGKGRVQLDHQQIQFGSPAPGIKISRRDINGTKDKCTIGPAVTAAGRTGFLTAGHCGANAATPQYAQAQFDGTSPLELGRVEQISATPSDDAGVIWTPEAAGDDTIAGAWKVGGTMTLASLQQLPVGTPICVDGAVSQVICSPLISVSGTQIISGLPTRGGDSGAAVFVIDARTKSALLIGVHRGLTDNGDAVATALEPILSRVGAKVVTAS